jgi:hypothetical protein
MPHSRQFNSALAAMQLLKLIISQTQIHSQSSSTVSPDTSDTKQKDRQVT